MNIDQLTINTIRILSAEAIEKAKSGHPGLPLGAAPAAYTLWSKIMKHNPKNPNWVNRDRFILSAGHGSMLLYSLLHIFDYGLTMEDIEAFRQVGSKTPGHPEYGDTVGVEATTGPLGQGFANGVGMAMAEAHLSAHFNRPGDEIVDHYTYVLSGDGCLMEGISNEAASLAGHLGLGKLIVLYDSNDITIEGGTNLAFTENIASRFKALGWETYLIEDGNDIEKIRETIERAKENSLQPSLIEIKTEIGYGSPKQGKSSAHGEPLGKENISALKEYLGWNEEDFTVPEEVEKHMAGLIEEGLRAEEEYKEKWEIYKSKYPDLAEEFLSWMDLDLAEAYLESEDFWFFDKDLSTREASGVLINRLADKLPNLIGGSADLAPSNKTSMEKRKAFKPGDYSGSNIHFGVREHAMGAVLNGMALHGGLRVYGGTFLVFSDYMKAAMRLSSLMNLPVSYVLTHDSIGVGEDGPTHQPIEHLAMLRSIPNMTTIRPADARETAAAWYKAMKNHGPTSLILSRQGLPLIEGTGRGALKGGYVLNEDEKLDIILIATGSELQLIYEAAKILRDKGYGIKLVSMPSWEIFEEQSEEYREEVLPKEIDKRLAVEAASFLGWHKYVGIGGKVISIDRFGASAPGGQLFKKFGFTVENIVDEALKILED